MSNLFGNAHVATNAAMTKPYFSPLVVRERAYDLSHLEPVRLMVPSQKAQRDLSVHVRFTTHCFTEGFDAEKHPSDEIVLDEGRRPRVFCPVRYELSPLLPGLLHGLNSPSAKVWQTAAGRNWTHSAIVEGRGATYYLFFEVRRTPPERRRLQDVEMMVESAYPILDGDRRPNVLGPMKFQLLIGNVFLGRPIATKR